MRINKIIVFILFVLCVGCFASEQEENFLKANNLYAEKDYKKALQLYGSISKKGPVTLYNMGNCEFNLGNYVDSIVYFLRARKNASFGLARDIDYNISQAYNKLDVSKEISVWQELQNYIDLFSLFALQLIFLFFWFLVFILWGFLKKARALIISINFFIIFIVAFTLFFKYRLDEYPFAISKKESQIFVGPNENYHKIGKLSVADKVVVQKIDKKWYKINTSGAHGVTGWVLSGNLEAI